MKRRKLGQHYLIDGEVVNKLIASAAIKPRERVLEIGTGRGVLTKELVKLGASLEGYEVDRGNFTATLAELGSKRAMIHLGDVFREYPSFDVLVSSLPYSRSADFVEWIGRVRYKRAVVLLQDDFVAKVMSKPGARDYRAISVIAQISSEFVALGRVGRSSFSPAPKVESIMLSIKPKRRMAESEIWMIKQIFSLRRREVASVGATFGIDLAVERYVKRRVNSLTPSEVLEICELYQTRRRKQRESSYGELHAT
ncbi:MAG TPA: rRNA adenine N-6-methyltransferase family protein [Nitrososphaerales archaeon]|nr:rRNA adenine N-6-methyltransferase family protein [Nitrososphaerales archaeon]